MAPLVTVAIPTRDRPKLLQRSLSSALRQSHPNLDIVVSDNASGPETAAFLATVDDPRVRVLRQVTNLGMVGNWNECLREARGEYFLLLSDDDALEPDAIAAMSAPFEQGVPALEVEPGELGMVWCPSTVVNEEDAALWTTAAGPAGEDAVAFIEAFTAGDRGYSLCGVLTRTEDLRKLGGYEPSLKYLADIRAVLDAALARGKVSCIDRPLARYTLHASNLTGGATISSWVDESERISAGWHRFREQATEAERRRLRAAGKRFVSNALATVTLHALGSRRVTPGLVAELVRNWRYLLSPYVAGRALRELAKIRRFVVRRR